MSRARTGLIKPVPVELLRVQDSLSAECSCRCSMVFSAWLCGKDGDGSGGLQGTP